ncbi:hypothetical protein CAP36_11820 [Chitinophagaceae bacterium IBVUCB2]|nr:hypothetical protein CAP36_11820 [Chitinophagaceae bacterium IBVUCB2]
MLQPITILIADDNHYIRKSLANILDYEPQFQIVGIAETGEQAIFLAAKLEPDILLLDINMKPLSGFAAIQPILENNPTIKIIGLSLHHEKAYSRTLFKLGAHGYMAKSESIDAMLNCMREVAAGNICIAHNKAA